MGRSMPDNRLVNRQKFAELARTGANLEGVALAASGRIIKADDAAATQKFRARISDDKPDLAGDRVFQNFEGRAKLPLLWSHDSATPPIGVVGDLQTQGGETWASL